MNRTRLTVGVLAVALGVSLTTMHSATVEARQARAETARMRQLLQERAQTLQGIADRLQTLAQSNAARPEEVFSAKTAAGMARIESVQTDQERLQIMQSLLQETVAYEKLVADSVRANPAAANDTRGQVDRLNAIAQMKVSRLELELAIERLKMGAGAPPMPPR